MIKETLTVYIGWDPRDHAAYAVAVESLKAHASVAVDIRPLVDRELRRSGVYWRSYSVDHRGQMWDAADGKPDMPGHEDAAYADEWWKHYFAGQHQVSYPLTHRPSLAAVG
jgi:hypothetical protein